MYLTDKLNLIQRGHCTISARSRLINLLPVSWSLGIVAEWVVVAIFAVAIAVVVETSHHISQTMDLVNHQVIGLA